jgi:DNA-binding NtrC family response regulator
MNKKVKVLVADDELGIRESLKAFLEDDGFMVFLADTAEASINILNQEEIDIAIVDLRLPGADGNSLIQEASQKKPNLKFILYTGSQASEIPNELLSQKNVSEKIFFKPLFDLEQFTFEINSLMQEK